MNARQKLRQAHFQEWAVRFAEQKASGLTVRQWCEQNDFLFTLTKCALYETLTFLSNFIYTNVTLKEPKKQ